jgi:hypothetical protein
MSSFYGETKKTASAEDNKRTKEEREALESAKRYFEAFDADGSGSISRDEFSLLYDDLVSCGFSMGSLQAALQDLDSNGDGEISLEEYITWLSRTNQRCSFPQFSFYFISFHFSFQNFRAAFQVSHFILPLWKALN